MKGLPMKGVPVKGLWAKLPGIKGLQVKGLWAKLSGIKGLQVKGPSLKRTALLIMGLTLLSYVLGFARESYIAYKFGATGMTDAFYIAAVVPEMAAGFISNALTAAFVPILKREHHLQTGRPQSLTDAVFLHAAIIASLLTVTGYLFRGSIIQVLAPGFSHAEYLWARQMLSIMMISVFFSALSGIMWGIYNANERYFFPALIGVVSNSVMLVTVAVLGHYIGIESLGYGITLGMIGRFTVQFFPLLKARQLQLPRVLWHPAIRDMLKLIPPTLITTGLASLNMVVDRVLASGLPGGQLTDLNFAAKLGFLPMGLIGASVATTLYTRFVTYTLDNEDGHLRAILQKTMTLTAFGGLFIGFVFNFFGFDIVALLYHHGAFSFKNVLITTVPLAALGWFLVFYLMQPILVRFFYARQDNKFVMFGGLLDVSVNIAVSVALVHPLGVLGLALGNSVSQLVFSVYLFIVMKRRLHWPIARMIWNALRDSVPLVAAFAAGCLVVAMLWSQALTVPLLWRLLRDTVAVTTGCAFLLMVARVTRNRMLEEAIGGSVRRRFGPAGD